MAIFISELVAVLFLILVCVSPIFSKIVTVVVVGVVVPFLVLATLIHLGIISAEVPKKKSAGSLKKSLTHRLPSDVSVS